MRKVVVKTIVASVASVGGEGLLGNGTGRRRWRVAGAVGAVGGLLLVLALPRLVDGGHHASIDADGDDVGNGLSEVNKVKPGPQIRGEAKVYEQIRLQSKVQFLSFL